ncbi:hypothetical protein WME95_01340 [Sorangium sp. So ce327]|jgi:hypothetical protein|uniref:hypothetical protein n=1 Tax=unclassified Sorangium TaxID=2621164 RepID=UPI003F634B52
MSKSRQILTVDPSDVVINFTYSLGQTNLGVNNVNTVNISVTNKSEFALQNVTLKQEDIIVWWSGSKDPVTSSFSIVIPGGKMVFSSAAPSTTSPTQGFFVTPTQQALNYISGTISFSIKSGNITYDVVADTGGQNTSDNWTVTTRN